MRTDVLIIGCGIAGATAALRLAADREREIIENSLDVANAYLEERTVDVHIRALRSKLGSSVIDVSVASSSLKSW